jgi:hypothetical protein
MSKTVQSKPHGRLACPLRAVCCDSESSLSADFSSKEKAAPGSLLRVDWSCSLEGNANILLSKKKEQLQINTHMLPAHRKSSSLLIIAIGGSSSMHVDLHKLIEFALGRLSPEDSLAVLDEVERDPNLSHDLELVIEILNIVLPNEPSADQDDSNGK